METPIPWGEAMYYVKAAALYPQRRHEMLAHALREVLTCMSVRGTALIWPCQERTVQWKVFYAGERSEVMHRWLTARLDASLETTLGVLQHDLTVFSEMPDPQIICLQASTAVLEGLWLLWPAFPPLANAALDALERLRGALEAVLEIARTEEHYFADSSPLFDPALAQALARGDAHALSAFLSLTRMIGHADLAFWGRAFQDVVEVNTHLGAQQNSFGFALQHGHGVGGRIAAYGPSIVLVGDYLTSPYRDSSVTNIVDGEHIRSALALPVRATHRDANHSGVAAVLYVTRRELTPFSLAERLLVQRLGRELEPFPQPHRPPLFVSPGLPRPPAWHELVLHANRVEVFEEWAARFIQGTVVVTNSEGAPYVLAHTEQLAHLRAGLGRPTDNVQVLPLNAPGVTLPGQIYLRPSLPLPPPDWPTFFADLVMACNLIIGRMEKTHDHLARQRAQWLQALLQEKMHPQFQHDGYRLGLPSERGQIWVIAWPARSLPALQLSRKRARAESLALETVKSPLLFLDDELAVLLLHDQSECQPAVLRDALLSLYAPHPFWLVHGVRYHSSHELKHLLTRALSLARQARREGRTDYLLDMQTPSLDNLLENPRLADHLRDFASRLLAPLLASDMGKNTHLTTTFVLAQTLGSVQEVADHLDVHVNTIRYRLHKAEDLLGGEQALPKERAAWTLAAFVWEHFHLSRDDN
ncbi:MAG TPA: helix-turn-helix domain-containing protein [Ktedonobacteraceae bacterium]